MTILNLSGRIAISRPFSGDPSQARAARRFVAAHLGKDHPCLDDAVQLTGELVAESLRHAATCGSRPDYTVAVTSTPASARVTLSTRACGCWTSPQLTPGRGVHLVHLFTHHWGVSASRTGVCVWFELGLETAQAGPGEDAVAGPLLEKECQGDPHDAVNARSGGPHFPGQTG
ncbi:ATP-binding protein [Microbispora sp. RL4-1S]|uniref:ATP-binding protein n=1 Tax=Microbispora oryzae TaxID=2806554 RepID=A0A940WJM7_9ACTN|nr:ATP-binding protein [Microbispora oryzae]MBP2705137.1 ATP-binding protein [Microbispora oryzae]